MYPEGMQPYVIGGTLGGYCGSVHCVKPIFIVTHKSSRQNTVLGVLENIKGKITRITRLGISLDQV